MSLSEYSYKISVNRDIGKPQPLLLATENVDFGIGTFIYPSQGDNIVLRENDRIFPASPGSYLKLNGEEQDVDIGAATCQRSTFSILKKEVRFKKITSYEPPVNIVVETGDHGDMTGMDVGFLLRNGRFITLMQIEINRCTYGSKLSKFHITKGIGGVQRKVPRLTFTADTFYDFANIEKLYERSSQRRMINGLVGLPGNSDKYIHDVDDYFLSKGHLTAKADFVYQAQQKCTFHYVNIAPQWGTFNNGNWNTLEQDIRTYVSEQGKDYVVYTGTHGIATLPHEKSRKEVELYLYVNGSKRYIPVPEFYWKVLYDPEKKAGIAFVGVNNPYQLQEPTIPCVDIYELDWLKWKPKNRKLGYSYCFKVDQIRRYFPEIPKDFIVRKTLL